MTKNKTINQRQYVRCKECKHAYLMRSDKNNPVVAQCNAYNTREVAGMSRVCQAYEEDFFKPINEMIKAE